MTMICGCPRCSTELALPDDAPDEATLECPVCGGKFARDAAAVRRAPLARIVSRPAPVETEPATQSAGDSLLSADPLESLSARLRSLTSAPAVLGDSPNRDFSQWLEDVDPATCDAPAADNETETGKPSINPLTDEASPFIAAEFESADAADSADPVKGRTNAGAAAGEEDPDQTDAQREAAEEIDSLLAELRSKSSANGRAALDLGARGSQPAEETPCEPLATAARDDVGDSLRDFARQSASSEAAPEPESIPAVSEALGAFRLNADASEIEELLADEAPAELNLSAALAARPAEAADAVTLSKPIAVGRPRRRVRGSWVRTLVGVVLFGAVGTLAGGYLMLWIGGRQADLLQLATVLPESMLPPAMRSAAGPEIASEKLLAVGGNDFGAEEPAIESEPPVVAAPLAELRPDAAVEAATASLAVESTSPLAAESAGGLAETPTTIGSHAEPIPELEDLAATALDASRCELAELAAAVATAERALPDFLAGDLSNTEAAGRTGRAYVALAQLAERATLAATSDDPNAAVTQRMLAKELFRRAGSEAERAGVIAQVAGQWLAYDKRSTAGVVVRGRVRDLHARGPWTEYELVMGDGDQAQIAAVLGENGRGGLGDEGVAAGLIVPQPTQRLVGYAGGAEVLVVAPCVFSLDEPRPIPRPGALLLR